MDVVSKDSRKNIKESGCASSVNQRDETTHVGADGLYQDSFSKAYLSSYTQQRGRLDKPMIDTNRSVRPDIDSNDHQNFDLSGDIMQSENMPTGTLERGYNRILPKSHRTKGAVEGTQSSQDTVDLISQMNSFLYIGCPESGTSDSERGTILSEEFKFAKLYHKKTLDDEEQKSFKRLGLQPSQRMASQTSPSEISIRQDEPSFMCTSSHSQEEDYKAFAERSTGPPEQEPAGEELVEDACLNFKIPEAELRKAMLATRSTGAAYWRYTLYENPEGCKPMVHYCQNLQVTERIVQLFLNKNVIGFDIEWKPNATSKDGIKNNVALIQLASEERIALFHIARYAKDGIENLVSPSLKRLMEDANITKVGVAVKSDCTRLAKYMGIQARGLFELSHLYKLIKHSTGNIKLIDKRLVSLAQQVEEHLQLPMFKGSVRSSDWTERLNFEQIRYAASDSYAGLQLYILMEAKRKALVLIPPRPAHAELNLPIRLANGQTVANYEMPADATVDEHPPKDDAKEVVQIEEMARDFMDIVIEDGESSTPVEEIKKRDANTEKPPEIVSAETWIQNWRAELPASYKPKATAAFLRAYFLWYHLEKTVPEAAAILRDPPLQTTTVANYILEALRIETLPSQVNRVADVLACLPDSVSKRRYQLLRNRLN